MHAKERKMTYEKFDLKISIGVNLFWHYTRGSVFEVKNLQGWIIIYFAYQPCAQFFYRLSKIKDEKVILIRFPRTNTYFLTYKVNGRESLRPVF